MLALCEKGNFNQQLLELNGRYITSDMFHHTDNTDVSGFQAMIILLNNTIFLLKHLAWTSVTIS